MFEEILSNVRSKAPLVHAITNYVTVNDCANMLLACGASPIMADDAAEVEEITAICAALVLNIGTLNARTIESMLLAGRKAADLAHPAVLDPVGAGASALRTGTALQIMQDVRPCVLRGNISEVKAVANAGGSTQGVDAAAADRVTEDNLDQAVVFAQGFSRQTGAVVAITGAIDIVADGSKAYVIRNGTALMSRVTGTGCMLSVLIGAFCAANPDHLLEATAAAVAAMGLCGELAQRKLQQVDGGTATYRTLIIDCMSKLDGATLAGGAKVEIR